VRILINNNNHIPQAAFAKHLFASGFDADVIGLENDELLSRLENGNFDLLAYYAEEIDEDFLLNLFSMAGQKHKILLLKRPLLENIGEELEALADEIFTIPLSFSDFSIRFRRLLRARQEGDKAENEAPRPSLEKAEPEEAEVEEETQAEPEESGVEEETQAEPGEAEAEEEAQGEEETGELEKYFEITAFESEGEESEVLTEEFEDTALEDRQDEFKEFQPDPQLPQEIQVKQEEDKPYSAQTDFNIGKGKRGKKKTPLRYLNKTELLEIILEQERIINEQIAKAQRIEEELAKREIILGQSGSIAEAATKISGIFEAAQDAADRYLESVIAANGSERTEPTEE